MNVADLILLCGGSAPYRLSTGRQFEFSFVWLKPFVKVFSRNVADFQPWVNAHLRPQLLPYPELEAVAISEGKLRSWQRVASDLAFADLGKIEIAYRTLWSGVSEKLRDNDAAKKINLYCPRENLLELNDNQITLFEIPILDSVLCNAGFLQVDHYDLTPPIIETYPTSRWQNYIGKPTGNFVTNAKTDFYVETYFNDFFIVIHGPEPLAEAIRRHPLVEGFFCNEFTTGGWCFDLGRQVGVWKNIESCDDIAVGAMR